jgi:hypothetical protein
MIRILQEVYTAPQNRLSQPLGMSYFKNTLYISVTGKILKLAIDSDGNGIGAPETIYADDATQLKVYDESLQSGKRRNL